MWFSLFVAVLILAITFYQGLLGLFSAVINCVLTVLAAALAFGLYEDIYYSYLLDPQPDDGRGIAFVAIFVISLVVMRVIVDLVITENMKFPMYVDRIGGGLLGLVTALIIIGVLGTGIQMLPFPHQWLGFTRYAMLDAKSNAPVSLTPKNDKDTEQDLLAKVDLRSVRFARRNLWLNPDGFAVSVASYLSDNALAGSNSLSRAHPALLDEEYWTRFTTVGQSTGVARKRDALTVESCWELPAKALLVVKENQEKKRVLGPATDEEDKVPAGSRLIAVRALLTKDAADDGTSFRFTTNQVRLFTQDKAGRTVSYGLAGLNLAPENLPAAASKDVFYRLREGETVVRPGTVGKFNFVFEVPDDDEVKPLYVVFRRNARAEIRAVQKDAPKTALFAVPGKGSGKAAGNGNPGATGGDGSGSDGSKKPAINMHSGTDADAAQQRSGGRTQRYVADEVGSFFSDELPLTLTAYDTESVEVSTGKVMGGMGRLTAKLDQKNNPIKGDKAAIDKFDVPKNKRLLQLSVRRLHPGSLPGQAIDFARQLASVSAKDESGREYKAIGTWGIATVAGARLFELVYYDEETQIGRSNVPAKLDRIRADDMRDDYALYYLFQVPPGTKIVSFARPNAADIDVSSQKLVAPK